MMFDLFYFQAILVFMVLGLVAWYLDTPRSRMNLPVAVSCYLWGWIILLILLYVRVSGQEDYMPHWLLCLLAAIPPMLAGLLFVLEVMQ